MTDHSINPIAEYVVAVLPESMPRGVIAFSFNISECGDWIVELIGASSYDPIDPDWACPPEAWSCEPHQLSLSRSLAGETWKEALKWITAKITEVVQSSSEQQAEVLRSARAVCVGFVDGELVRVWPREA